MAELGLFTPGNPVTHATPAQAVAAAVQGGTPGGGCGEGGHLYPEPPPPKEVTLKGGTKSLQFQPVPDLPPELKDRGFIRFLDCQKKRDLHYRNRVEALICNSTTGPNNPWVDCKLLRVLIQLGDGRLALAENACLQGFGATEFKVYDLDGKYLCSSFPPIPNPPDSKLPQPKYGDPGTPFGRGYNLPIGGGGGGTRLPSINIAGLDVGSIYNLITGNGQNVDLSGVLLALAALVATGGNIRGSLDQIAPALGEVLGPGFGAFSQALDGLAPGLGGRLALALDAHANTTANRAQDAAAVALASSVPLVGPLFAELVAQGPSLLSKIADGYKFGVDALIRAMLDLFRDDIEAHAPVTPANVDKVAAAALRSALTAGSVAQLSGMGLELLHPLKQLGVQQAIGVLAEFAGFAEIAKPFFNATLRYGIGLPAEHRAAAHFRSVLPPVGDVRELAARGLIPLDKYADRLVLAGYPDPFPAAYQEQVYAEISPRALAAFTDGSEADRPWLARKLRYAQLSPEDSDRIVRALELKATQPGRSRVVSALMDSYKAGRLEAAELVSGLDAAGLSVTHRGYYARAADLERRGVRMEAIATEVILAYRNDTVGEATARQELTALGFGEDEVTLRMTAAQLRRGVKQVQDEEKAIEAEIRALKSKGLAAALKQMRAGFLDAAQVLTVAQGMGYSPALARTAIAVALLQGAPKTTPAEAAIGLGAAEEARARIADLIAQEVQLKRTDRLAALAALRGLGLPHDLASTIVQIAEALGGGTPRAGEYGMPAGGRVTGAFGLVAESVLGGLGSIKSPADAVIELLRTLGLPGRDRSALTRLIRDIRDLFRL